MIEFDKKEGTSIPAESTEKPLPTKEDVQRFFEMSFKKDVDDYLIYKKNQFRSPNVEIIKDFISKLESFVKNEVKDEKQNFVDLVFKNIEINIKMLEKTDILPDDKKMRAFLFSFLISKFFS